MPVRIRLQRHGKKGSPFYHIVVADGRAPRDGKFIEKLGTYNPMTQPAQVDLDIDKAVQWMRNGAQPSDTVRSILSHKGAMLKHHLLRGVDKGAMTVEQAETKFQSWVTEKENIIQKLREERLSNINSSKKEKMAAEAKVKEARAEVIAKKKADALAQITASEAPVATPVATPEAAPVAEPEPEPEAAPVAELEATPVAEPEVSTTEEVKETPAE